MGKLKKWRTEAVELFGPIGVGFAAVLGVIASLQSLLGIAPVAGEKLMSVALALFLVCGALTIIRLALKVREQDQWLGNEHARSLWRDGIPAMREEYLNRIRTGDFATVTRFWTADFVNVKDAHGRSDIHVACENGHGAIVRGLLDRGADPKQVDGSNRTPLMLAMWKGTDAVIDALLAHDCIVNATCSEDGCSALHYAAAHGHLDVVKKLLRSGANLDRVNHDHMSPLMGAIVQQRWPVVRHLISEGADLKRPDAAGATTLDYAVNFSAPVDIVQAIEEKGVSRADPALKSSGSGFSRYGHARANWTKV